jgi:hypothetical protein
VIRLSFAFMAMLVAMLGGYAVLHPSWLALPALVLGWYLADMASGIIHMTFDYLPCPTDKGLDTIYFYEDSRESEDYLRLRREAMARIHPFWRLVYDFKNHHPRPDALGRRSITDQIWSTVVVGSIPIGLGLIALCVTLGLPGWAAAGSVSFLVGASYAQYFHGTLHRPKNPWFIVAMRRAGLLMTPARHQLHHDTLRRDFATNCGWSNPVLNRVFSLLHRVRILRDEGLEPAG